MNWVKGGDRAGLAERAKRRQLLKDSAPEALIWAVAWLVFFALSAALGQTRSEGWEHRWGAVPSLLYGAGFLCQALGAMVVILVMLMAAESEPEGHGVWNGPPPSARATFWGWACLGATLATLAGSALGRFALGLEAHASGWAVVLEAACVGLDCLSGAALLWAFAAAPRSCWRDLKHRARMLSKEELPGLEKEILERALPPASQAQGPRRSSRL